MTEFEKYISIFIRTQFPAFYRDEESLLVDFLTKYYEWLEEDENIINKSRSLLEYRDIDKTLDVYIKNFKRKYLVNLPDILITNKRQFIKFILDFYRAKGTTRGVELFFRSIYNANSIVYSPSIDILKPSDNIWKTQKYIEVSDNTLLSTFIGNRITNNFQTAEAIVEDYVKTGTDSRIINILYLSNLVGTFSFNDKINLLSNTDFSNAPSVTGSLTYVNVDGSKGTNYSVGDVLQVTSNNGKNAKALVTTISQVSNGYVDFTILNGGSGYTVNSNITVTGGGTGSGATFKIGSISNPQTLLLYTDIIAPYLSKTLNGIYNFPKFPTANLSTIIDYALSSNTYTIGTIATLTNIDPGSGYTSNPSVSVIDPVISSFSISDGAGGILGNNAIISATATISVTGTVETVKIIDSGIGYINGETVTMTGISPNNISQVIGTGYLLEQGKDSGKWLSSNSFLSSNKYLQDSHYYQEYSYEIQTNIPPDNYKDTVLTLMHPAGTAAFTKFMTSSEIDSKSYRVNSSIAS